MKLSVLGLVAVVACGSSAKQPDAASGASADAALDAVQPTGTHHHYVLDLVTLPNTTTSVNDDGFDLDGDGQVNNALGALSHDVDAQTGVDIQAMENIAVDQGTVLMLADFQGTSFTNATNAGFTTYVGMNAIPAPCNGPGDTVCRHHLQGDGTFDVAAMPRDPQLLGDVHIGTFKGGGGRVSLALSVGGGVPQLYTLLGARTEIAAGATEFIGKIGGAITKTEVTAKVVPAIQATLMIPITRDCMNLSTPPGCGCPTGSGGANVLALFDTDHDCAVSTFEVEGNSLFMSLLTPDVTIDGQPCVSIGVSVHAVAATFTP
jgi:hypothetical protein